MFQKLVQTAIQCVSGLPQSLLPKDLPSHFVHTTAGATATHCPDRSDDMPPIPSIRDTTMSLRDSLAAALARIDPAATLPRAGKMPSMLPIVAGDGAGTRSDALARQTLLRSRVSAD